MDKLSDLKAVIGRYDAVTIAFSGGVDSSFLAKVAGEVLKLKYPAFQIIRPTDVITAKVSCLKIFFLLQLKKIPGLYSTAATLII